MPRQLASEREKEYQELLAFLDFYCTVEFFSNAKNENGASKPPDIKQAAEKIAREFGKSKALIGARQAINDCVEDLGDKSPEYIELLNAGLRAAGLLTISEIRSRYAVSYKRILRRRVLKNETEYYLINGLVVDQANALNTEDRAALQSMLDAYEASVQTH